MSSLLIYEKLFPPRLLIQGSSMEYIWFHTGVILEESEYKQTPTGFNCAILHDASTNLFCLLSSSYFKQECFNDENNTDDAILRKIWMGVILSTLIDRITTVDST